MNNPFKKRQTVTDVMKPFMTALNQLDSIAENRIALANAAEEEAAAVVSKADIDAKAIRAKAAATSKDLKAQAAADRAESNAAIAMSKNLQKLVG